MQSDRSIAINEAITKEEFVTRRLREMVISGELSPGTRLRQQQIADTLRVSATPVREALRRLVSEGYLKSVAHVGVTVVQPNPAWRREVYEVRQRLEGYLAAKAAAEMTTDKITLLRQLNDEFREACQRRDYVEARLINYRLHRIVWEGADRPLTVEIANNLWAKFPFDILARVEGRDRRTVDEHERLIAALEARDGEAAEQAIFDHIRSGRIDSQKLAGAEDRDGQETTVNRTRSLGGSAPLKDGAHASTEEVPG